MKNQINKQLAFSLYGLTILEDSPSIETKLTFLLFTYLFNTPFDSFTIFKDEILEGRETYSEDGSRRYTSLGAGIPPQKINKAIKLVIKRGLFLIKQTHELLEVKLNNQFINDEAKNFLTNWQTA